MTELVSVVKRSPALLATAFATVLSLIWFVLPPSGSDLAAQVAHADFFGRDGWLPVDMRWFGGTDVFGYSIISPPMMAALGVGLFGVLVTIAASGLLGLVLQKCKVPHPRMAALVGTGCFAANLMAGRLTFALGVAAGLATILCLWVEGRWRLPLLAAGHPRDLGRQPARRPVPRDGRRRAGGAPSRGATGPHLPSPAAWSCWPPSVSGRAA